jgi:hypothetical protein
MESLFGQVTAFVTVLIMVAVFVEAILEAFAPLLEYIKNIPIKTTVNLVLGAILGVATAWGMGLRVEAYLTFLPLVVPAVASYILIGCAAGAGGSRFWHAVLGFLSNLHFPALPTTTTTTVTQSDPPSTKVETTTTPAPVVNNVPNQIS